MVETPQRPSLPELEHVLLQETNETRRIRAQSLVLRITNLLGRLVETSTDTKAKSLVAFSGMLGVVALSMILDGNIALVTSNGLAVIGGALTGDRIPLVSGPIEFVRERKKILVDLQNGKDTNPKKIAPLLTRHADIIELEELQLWGKKVLSEESALHPDRYRLVRKALEKAQTPVEEERIVWNFMEAQKLAQKERRLPTHILLESLKKAVNVGIGTALMVGLANWISFGLNHPSAAGMTGLLDDGLIVAVVTYSKLKRKVMSFLSGFNS